MSIANNIPETIMVIFCKNDNPELVDILTTYLEEIPNISKMAIVEQYTCYNPAAEFVYIPTKTLKNIFFKLYDYIEVYSVHLVKVKNPIYYTYRPKALFDYKTNIRVYKKALNQYIKDI